MPEPKTGRRIIDYAKNNAADIMASVATVGAAMTIGYFGGKVALATTGIIGGGLFMGVVTQETLKRGINAVISSFSRPQMPEGLRRQDMPGPTVQSQM